MPRRPFPKSTPQNHNPPHFLGKDCCHLPFQDISAGGGGWLPGGQKKQWGKKGAGGPPINAPPMDCLHGGTSGVV